MGFQCRQFYIKDDQCAMKVSTDSLLLGSYVPIAGARRILDMGTGSGLLALMLAQRAASADIYAFDADAAAVQQARENTAASPWPERIRIEHSCVTAWQTAQPYDLVVCNPPYFPAHLASVSKPRHLARQGQVPPQTWLECVNRCLADHGRFYWVLPVTQAPKWGALAEQVGLHRCRVMQVKTTASKPTKLVIEGWQWQAPEQVEQEALVIHAKGGGYSDAFRELTGEYYLAGAKE